MVTKIYKNAISSFVTGEVMINHGTFEVTEISKFVDGSRIQRGATTGW